MTDFWAPARKIKGRLPVSATVLYGAAALIAPSIVPYTLTVMSATITTIQAKAEGRANAPSDSETRALVEKWSGQNLHRAYIAGTASILSAIAMLA